MTDQPNIPKVPKALEKLADVVLAYRPKPKSAPAKKRKRWAAKSRMTMTEKSDGHS
jgi:hypothetical protein